MDIMNQEVTWQRFRDLHYEVGEDFFDVGDPGINKPFMVWLMAKYPEIHDDLHEESSRRFFSILDLSEEFPEQFGYSDEHDIERIYMEIAEFCKTNEAARRAVNEIIINKWD